MGAASAELRLPSSLVARGVLASLSLHRASRGGGSKESGLSD